MTIEQAIDDLMDASRSIAEVAESESDEANRINAQNVADDCKQLAEWLRELQERRKERDYWQEKAHSYEQTIFKLTDAISKQSEIVRCDECRHRDPEDKKCDCGHDIIWQLPRDDDWFCADAERRTDGENLPE